MLPDENNEFEVRKKEILAPIYFEAGAALFDCQSFESSIAYFLYLLARSGKRDLNPADIAAILDGDEKKTAGQLIVLLKKKIKVSDGIESALSTALQARNKLIHRYLYENIERLMDLNEHEKIIAEIRSLRSKVRSCQEALDPFIKGLAILVDGLDIDKFTTDVKTTFLRDTREH